MSSGGYVRVDRNLFDLDISKCNFESIAIWSKRKLNNACESFCCQLEHENGSESDACDCVSDTVKVKVEESDSDGGDEKGRESDGYWLF